MMEDVDTAMHDLPQLSTIASNGSLPNSPLTNMKPATPSMQPLSTPADIVATDDIQLPMVLLFGTEKTPQGYLIPQQELAKIPKHVIHHILKSGQAIGEGAATVHMLGATPLCSSLLRLKDYLDHGDYAPFDPKEDLHTVDKSGKIFTWLGSKSAAADQEGLQTTDETHCLFKKEVSLYIFAGCYHYNDLLTFSSYKIRTAYPVLAKETMYLLKKAHRIATQSEDYPLIDFIHEAIRKNAKGLVDEPDFLPLLRRSVKDDPVSQIVLEAYIKQTQEMKTARDVEMLLSNIPINNLPTPMSPTVKSEHSYEKHSAKPLVPTASEILFQFKDAITYERLVVAKGDGYGTLMKPNYRDGDPIPRNKDFKFIKNELLLISHSARASSSRLNIIVENSKGMKGDILHTLVSIVPKDLGSGDYEVNCGKEDLDREQRARKEMDHVYSYRHSRSRSPPRRN